MLVLSRKLFESLDIGPNIQISVVDIQPHKVKLGIEAPPDVLIVREELKGKPFSKSFPTDGSHISISTSVGELVDKLTILDIKLQNITDPDKLENISLEKKLLTDIFDHSMNSQFAHLYDDLLALRSSLYAVNSRLWDIENRIRECESNQDFSDKFVQLARSVYLENDARSNIKRTINTLCGSKIIEEKSYSSY